MAHVARVYDYWLGGKDNYAAGRAAGDAVIDVYPDILSAVLANRAFLAGVVRYLVAEAASGSSSISAPDPDLGQHP